MPVETVERARYATSAVICLARTPGGGFRMNGTVGSAFFVNEEGYFMTAAHVIASLEQRNQDREGCAVPAVYLPKGGWESDRSPPEFQWYGFTECLRDDGNDIAACRPQVNPFRDPLVNKGIRVMTFAARATPPDGTPVAFTGFPLHLVRPVTSKANVASYLPSESVVMIDKTAWPGASGSPLYLSDGSVAGMVVRAGRDEASGLAYARPAWLLTEFLAKNKIAFRQQK